MLVKKINPEWFPAENNKLAVGDTIEITDPKSLIVSGDVVGLDENGNEVSAFELYGVVIDTEMQEFQSYMKLKKAEQERDRLLKEKETLEAEVKSTDTVAVDTSKTATEVVAEAATKTVTETKKTK